MNNRAGNLGGCASAGGAGAGVSFVQHLHEHHPRQEIDLFLFNRFA